MKQLHRKLALVIGSVLVVLGLLFWMLIREPHHNGKPLSYWLEQGTIRRGAPLSIPMSPAEYPDEAIEAIQAIGTEAIPMLVDLLDTRESSLFRRLRLFLFRHRIRTDTPQLKEARAIGALVALGKDSIPALLELWDSEEELRPHVLSIYRKVGPDSRMISRLFEGLEDSLGTVRANSAYHLSRSDAQPGEVLPRLVAALNQELDPAGRKALAFSVGRYGEVAKPYLPSLIPIYQREDEHVQARIAAAGAVVRIDGTQDEALDLLLAYLVDEELTLFDRSQVAFALGDVSNAPPRVVEALEAVLPTTRTYFKAATLKTLKKLKEAKAEVEVSQ